MMMWLFACLGVAIDLNPDLTFEDCLPIHATMSEYPMDVLQCVGARKTDYAQVEGSHTYFYDQPDTEHLTEKLKRTVWMNITDAINQKFVIPSDSGPIVIADEIAKEMRKTETELFREAEAKTEEAFKKLLGNVVDMVGNISESLEVARENLRSLSDAQMRTKKLADIFRRLLGHMDNINACNINLAKIGRSLFLNGESRSSSEVLAECIAITNSNITMDLEDLNTSSRRQLSPPEAQPQELMYGLENPVDGSINIPACLSMAKHSKCREETQCKGYSWELFSHVEKQCIFFVGIVKNTKSLMRAKSYEQSANRVSSWLQILRAQASEVANSTSICAANAESLYELNERNAKHLAKSVKCAALGVEEWNTIVKECIAANDISRVYIPYYNIVTLLNASQCVSLMNGIIAVAITFGATFLLYILWSICKSCGLCKKNKQQQQSLPMYMNPYGGMPPFAMPSPQVQWQASSSPSRLEILDIPAKKMPAKKKQVRSARAAGA